MELMSATAEDEVIAEMLTEESELKNPNLPRSEANKASVSVNTAVIVVRSWSSSEVLNVFPLTLPISFDTLFIMAVTVEAGTSVSAAASLVLTCICEDNVEIRDIPVARETVPFSIPDATVVAVVPVSVTRFVKLVTVVSVIVPLVIWFNKAVVSLVAVLTELVAVDCAEAVLPPPPLLAANASVPVR